MIKSKHVNAATVRRVVIESKLCINSKKGLKSMKSNHVVKLTSMEPDVCGEKATGEAEILCNYHSLWKLRLTFLSG